MKANGEMECLKGKEQYLFHKMLKLKKFKETLKMDH